MELSSNTTLSLKCERVMKKTSGITLPSATLSKRIKKHCGNGLTTDISNQQAHTYFVRVLTLENRHAGAWSGKAFAELYLDRPQEALASVESGFNCIRHGIGYAMGFEPVNTNVLESLFRCKVLA